MTEETRKVLDYLDEVFSKRDQTSREVATILSALRGDDAHISGVGEGFWPNNQPNKPKDATMSVRMEAFPKTCDTSNYDRPIDLMNSCWGIHPEGRSKDLTSAYPVAMLVKAGFHFMNHVTEALEVLGWTMQKSGTVIVKPGYVLPVEEKVDANKGD